MSDLLRVGYIEAIDEKFWPVVYQCRGGDFFAHNATPDGKEIFSFSPVDIEGEKIHFFNADKVETVSIGDDPYVYIPQSNRLVLASECEEILPRGFSLARVSSVVGGRDLQIYKTSTLNAIGWEKLYEAVEDDLRSHVVASLSDMKFRFSDSDEILFEDATNTITDEELINKVIESTGQEIRSFHLQKTSRLNDYNSKEKIDYGDQEASLFEVKLRSLKRAEERLAFFLLYMLEENTRPAFSETFPVKTNSEKVFLGLIYPRGRFTQRELFENKFAEERIEDIVYRVKSAFNFDQVFWFAAVLTMLESPKRQVFKRILRKSEISDFSRGVEFSYLLRRTFHVGHNELMSSDLTSFRKEFPTIKRMVYAYRSSKMVLDEFDERTKMFLTRERMY